MRKKLTNLPATKLDSLSALHGGVSFGDGVVLHETIGALQRDLRQSTELVEHIKHLTF
jgi:hypothetical protein